MPVFFNRKIPRWRKFANRHARVILIIRLMKQKQSGVATW